MHWGVPTGSKGVPAGSDVLLCCRLSLLDLTFASSRLRFRELGQHQRHMRALHLAPLHLARLLTLGTRREALRAATLPLRAPGGRQCRQAPARPTHHCAAAASGPQQQQQQGVAPPASKAQLLAQQQQAVGMALDSPRSERPPQAHPHPHRRPKLWWKDRPSYRCPACGQSCFKVSNLETHILRCCPDVAPPEEWRALMAQADAAQREAQAARAREHAAGQQAAVHHAAEQPEQEAEQQAGGEAEQQRHAHHVPHQWKVHPADAAIRTWLEEVQRREDESRRKAVSAWG